MVDGTRQDWRQRVASAVAHKKGGQWRQKNVHDRNYVFVEYNWRSSQGPKVEEVTVTKVSEDVRDNPSCSCKYLVTSQGGTVCGELSLV